MIRCRVARYHGNETKMENKTAAAAAIGSSKFTVNIIFIFYELALVYMLFRCSFHLHKLYYGNYTFKCLEMRYSLKLLCCTIYTFKCT